MMLYTSGTRLVKGGGKLLNIVGCKYQIDPTMYIQTKKHIRAPLETGVQKGANVLMPFSLRPHFSKKCVTFVMCFPFLNVFFLTFLAYYSKHLGAPRPLDNSIIYTRKNAEKNGKPNF